MTGTSHFKRFVKELKKLSPHLELRRIKYGFYRIYWKSGGEAAYIHEVYSQMPPVGYDIEEVDYRFEHKSLYEQYEDRAELTRKIKNYVEGYADSYDKIRRRVYMLRNDKEFRKEAINAYRTRKVK